MRIIVYPHAMELGGSQINAVQLATEVRDAGHEVVVFSAPGVVVERVRAAGLPHVEIPLERGRPSARVIRQLRALSASGAVDVVHGFEWPPAVEAIAAAAGPGGAPHATVATVMSMSVVPFFPRTVPLMVGTEQIAAAARAAGHTRVTLLEPPVDTAQDHPGAVDASGFRADLGLDPELPLVAIVSRLAPDLKLESLLASCAAVAELSLSGTRVQLVIAGDGPAREQVAEAAARANARAGRRVVVLAGELADPRPAYAAADVVVGMGSSALRGMAFGKPLVVVGEDGFSELFEESTVDRFLWDGFFGLGPGSRGAGVPALAESIRVLAESPETRARLGEYGRGLVDTRFSLRRAAGIVLDEYAHAVAHRPALDARLADAAQASAGIFRYKVNRKVSRWRGRLQVDDANAKSEMAKLSAHASTAAATTAPGPPVAAQATAAQTVPGPTPPTAAPTSAATAPQERTAP
ncbi:glycosyltransferase family 4 protein [Actinokineospora spheciospongiae]|uniref:glycosyltransferase family 4 protein n=1 Tax=Actinokineospora spheciospongiae TaxID=909613 RepID=UPI000D7158DE|nr:glycosyltransferase family 4 protein [Actinokineospora spheciospongiae]PWW64087.1 glycosyltransferase involved in cell wall biosynthesis [Actinokineospora spheciospongiae]